MMVKIIEVVPVAPSCARMPPIRVVMPTLRIDRMVVNAGREMSGVDPRIEIEVVGSSEGRVAPMERSVVKSHANAERSAGKPMNTMSHYSDFS